MMLALTDAIVVVGMMALIGLLGYWMDGQVDHDDDGEKHPDSKS